MTKKQIYVTVVIVIIVIGFFIFNKPNIGSNTHTQSATTTPIAGNIISSKIPVVRPTVSTPNTDPYVMIYSKDGFSPGTLQVPRGTSVRFINKSDSPLLIVADDQTNSVFNQINQPKAVAKGGVYTFDFSYTGVWAFHNANVAKDKGNIVVY